MTSLDQPPARSLAERTVDAITSRLARGSVSRRRFLTRATVAASALAVDPIRYVLRPGTAYATVCGEAASCSGGWTAFCCTINDGANTCPPGSFAAGWWKIDESSFCRGAPRYIIDCNRLPSASCSCTCADGECDKRRVCCNVFRYGQCHHEVPGVTEVVCRVVTCTVPWEWDEECSDTVRTDNRTATHTATCLPGQNPSWIEIKYMDIGLVGSIVGRPTRGERDVAGGGRRADYDNGMIVWSEATDAHALDGPIAERYDAEDATGGPLGYATTDARDVGDDRGRWARFERGSIWWSPETGAHAVHGPIHDRYELDGGAAGWLGYLAGGIESRPGPWRRVATDEGWAVVHQTERDEVRVLPADVELPEDGSWPQLVEVERWAGPDRIATAAAVAHRMWPDGADLAFVASARDFADALSGGVAAALHEAPLLLTEPDEVPPALVDALDRLGVERVVVLGGPRAVSEEVATALRARVGSMHRWDGEDRYATAARISRQLFPDGAEVVHVATGRAFPDALAAVPAAVSAGGPILLVDTDEVPDVVVDELRRLGARQAVVLGGPVAISSKAVRRLEDLVPEVARRRGEHRYDTAAELSEGWSDQPPVDTVFVACGTDFPDGLSAGAAAGVVGAPVLLARPDEVPDATWTEFRRLEPRRVVLVGGTQALSAGVQRHLAAAPAPSEPEPEPTEPEPSPTEPEPSPTPTGEDT